MFDYVFILNSTYLPSYLATRIAKTIIKLYLIEF